ncbi:MAG: hypothetical protein EXR79_04895 [Myxococcales bacterium]|nr:hypothetical protein [Myxococcales bacterium]
MMADRDAPGPPGLRGMLTGEGVFESLRLDRDCALAAPPGWTLHLDRLRRGASRLELPWPGDVRIAAALASAQAAHGPGTVRARFTLWADGGAPLHEPPRRCAIAVTIEPLQADEQDPRPWSLAIGGRVRNPAARLWDCKHVGLAEALAWRRAARADGADDALLCAVDGQLSEATTSTAIFGLSDGTVVTPGPGAAALPGTALARLRKSLPIADGALGPGDLEPLDWAVLVNAIWGVRVVARIGSHPLGAPPHTWLAAARATLDPAGHARP